MKGTTKCSLLLILVLMSGIIKAQTVSTTTDKKNILIGEQFQYKVEALFPENRYSIHWLEVPDSFSHFEVIGRGKPDTALNNGTISWSQVITLTSFDSGNNVIPSFNINFIPITNDTTLNVQTDTIPILVSFSPLDSTKTFHDIKTILDVKEPFPLWKWIAAVFLILLIVLIILLIRYFKKRNKDEVFSSSLTPFDEAMKSLQKLKEENLLKKNEVKQFHTKLSDIFRRYISRKTHTNLLNRTSAEILLLLQESNLNKESVSRVAGALRMSDAVKFAKYYPPLSENEISFQNIQQAIKQINEPSTIENSQ